jgi:hypothetical protein
MYIDTLGSLQKAGVPLASRNDLDSARGAADRSYYKLLKQLGVNPNLTGDMTPVEKRSVITNAVQEHGSYSAQNDIGLRINNRLEQM